MLELISALLLFSESRYSPRKLGFSGKVLWVFSGNGLVDFTGFPELLKVIERLCLAKKSFLRLFRISQLLGIVKGGFKLARFKVSQDTIELDSKSFRVGRVAIQSLRVISIVISSF